MNTDARPRFSQTAPRSLRRRLMWMLLGGAAVLAVLFFVILRGYAQQVAQQSQDRILEASVTSVLDTAAVRDGQVAVDLPYAAFAMLDTPADDRVFYAIHVNGALLTGYDGLPGAPRLEGPQPSFATREFGDAAIRVATMVRRLPATTPIEIAVTVAQTRDALAGTLLSISANAGALGGAFFLLAAALSVLTSAATVRPLAQIAASVARRGPSDLSPVRREVPDELTPLVGSLNSLMGRLNQSLTQSETFIAEAAHRVRTPLATVRSHAEATLMRVDKEDNRQSLRSMIRAIDESSRAAGQLLDHAMVTFRGDHLEKQDVDLVAICSEIAERLAPVAAMRDIDVDVIASGPVALRGDPILIQNAVRNLVDNALKYSPSETRVEVAVTDGPPTVMVRDHGSGFPEHQIKELTQRFQRGANAAGSVGSGLGLTIVQDVAEAHGGALTLSNAQEGGACAILSF